MLNEKKKSTKFTIHRTNNKPLYFEGVLLGTVESVPQRQSLDYSGIEGVSIKIEVYRTQSFRCVLSFTRLTNLHDERNIHEAFAVDSAMEAQNMLMELMNNTNNTPFELEDYFEWEVVKAMEIVSTLGGTFEWREMVA